MSRILLICCTEQWFVLHFYLPLYRRKESITFFKSGSKCRQKKCVAKGKKENIVRKGENARKNRME